MRIIPLGCLYPSASPRALTLPQVLFPYYYHKECDEKKLLDFFNRYLKTTYENIQKKITTNLSSYSIIKSSHFFQLFRYFLSCYTIIFTIYDILYMKNRKKSKMTKFEILVLFGNIRLNEFKQFLTPYHISYEKVDIAESFFGIKNQNVL